jgi:hypothetical protein
MAFGCIAHDSFVRKYIIWLLEWKWFDRFITLVIFVNSVLLAMRNYDNRLYGDTCKSEDGRNWNNTLD